VVNKQELHILLCRGCGIYVYQIYVYLKSCLDPSLLTTYTLLVLGEIEQFSVFLAQLYFGGYNSSLSSYYKILTNIHVYLPNP